MPAELEPLDQERTAGRIAHLRRAWWGVVAVFLVHGLVVSTWVSRIASVKTGLRLGEGGLGLALLGAAIGSITAIPISGWLIDRFGSRRVVLWTGTGFASSLALLALAPNPLVLFVALIAYGAMAGANDVAINANAVGVEKQMAEPTMSRFHAMFSLGGIVGSVAGGWIAAAGIGPQVHLPAATILIIGFVLIASRLLAETGEPSEQKGHMLFKPPRALIGLSIIGFCMFLSEGAIADWTAVYLKQVLQAGEGTAAAGYAAFSATMTVFRLTGDHITSKLGRAWTIRVGSWIAALGLLVVVLATSPAMGLIGFAVSGIGFSSIVPVVFAAGGRVGSVSEATGVATVSGIGYLGFLVGPPTIGFVSEATSLRGGIFVLVLLCILGALLVRVVEKSSSAGSNPLADS